MFIEVIEETFIRETVPVYIDCLIIGVFILFIEFLILIIIGGIMPLYLGEKFGLLIAKTLFHSLPTKFQVFYTTKELNSREAVTLIGVLGGIAIVITTLVYIIEESFFIYIDSFFEFPIYYYSINIPTLFTPTIVFISTVITVILYAWKENINIKNKQLNEVTT